MIINQYNFAPAASYGSLTTAWINATGESNTTILNGLDQFDIDTTSLGAKRKLFYPFVGATALKHSYNFFDTAIGQLSFTGGWVQDSYGATANGINTIAYTGIAYNTLVTQNSAHIGVYSGTDITSNNYLFGVAGDITWYLKCSYIQPGYGGTTLYMSQNATDESAFANTDSRGYYGANRVASGTLQMWKDGVKVSSPSNTSTGVSTKDLTIGALFTEYFTFRHWEGIISGADCYDGLTDGEEVILRNAMQTLQTTLGRQV